ncbi:glycoside hydrolase family 57 [Thermocrinis albus DSM 14484]|uniref:Glycoside hydrolase family 57 n=1 Tax=Thermocrinis albus (strain DSM 14484 / JCM 11386 / HI 11/12) TaxID=638303 RepID=D3SMQ0_THEAH|nr:DUF3536 domain-containing protein [Thermocrinis albus]ADC90030.1 glycoside hydrolase family 57 [Thermocrinis albus DSM 14484]
MIIFHGHFYQPARENPYTGEIHIEPSAEPFENWNERVYRECYLPNAYAHRVEDHRVTDIVNNYRYMSFDFGCTLLRWIEKKHPELLEKIREGRGAMASTFNHTILPLDPPEDREIQIAWGIRAFQKFFGRNPKGFWLPELAVDSQTLRLLIKHGIEYIILAPHQVKTKSPYARVFFQEGHLDVFIYHHEVSHGIAFGDLLQDATTLLKKLLSLKQQPLLVAVDGETFGHHKKFGEMALAYLFSRYGDLFTTAEDYHSRHVPTDTTQVVDFTSWSCPHGVERWRDHCGCSTGGLPGWHQRWRKPLREGLEEVRRRIRDRVFNTLDRYLKDSFRATLDFVEVLLGGSKEDFLACHSKRSLSREESRLVFRQLYALLYCHLAFSSDGWFFADISGIETVKNLLYAKKAIDLVEDPEAERILTQYLAEAPGNTERYPNGLMVYQRLVLPQVYTPKDMAVTVALMYLADVEKAEGQIGSWRYKVEGYEPITLYLSSSETEEEYVFHLSFEDLSLERVPDVFLNGVVELWINSYLHSFIEATEDYGSLLERIVKHSSWELLVKQLTLFLQLHLWRSLTQNADPKTVEEILKEAQDLRLNIHAVWLRELFLQYALKKAQETPHLLKEVVRLIKDYNRDAKSWELMVDLWPLQNYVWENRNQFKDKELFELLNLEVPDATL